MNHFQNTYLRIYQPNMFANSRENIFFSLDFHRFIIFSDFQVVVVVGTMRGGGLRPP